MAFNNTIRGLLLMTTAALGAAVQAGEARRVEGLEFRRIDVVGKVSVLIYQGDETLMKMYGVSDELDRDPFYLRGDRLVLGSNPAHRGYDFGDVKFKVEVPDLRELHLKGSGDVYVKPLNLRDNDGRLECALEGNGDIRLFGIDASALELRVNGNGDIQAVDVNADRLDAIVAGNGNLFLKRVRAAEGSFSVNGSGDITVVEEGSVDALEVNVIGSGDVAMKSVSARAAEVRIVGSGDALIGEISDAVDCSILGSGDVRFYGDPEVESVQLGAGECRSRD